MRSRWIAEAGLWLALAVVLPVTAHPLGVGPALLPMHLPVLLAGAVSGPGVGLATGLLAPGLSHLVTGMPPIVPPMTVELATYGLVASLVRRRFLGDAARASMSGLSGLVREYFWLMAAWLAGRLALTVAAGVLGPLLGLRIPAIVYVKGAILIGVPGLLLQALVIPPLVARLRPFASPVRHPVGVARCGSDTWRGGGPC